MADPSPHILALFGWITPRAVHSLERKANLDAARSLEDPYAKAIESTPAKEPRSLAVAMGASMKKILAAALAASLAACGPAQVGQWAARVAPSGPGPTLVLPPGFAVSLGGQPATIFGFDPCPATEPAMALLFGPSAGEEGCVALRPEASAVVVRVVLGGQLSTERWTVERSSASGSAPFDRTSLRRPDGSFVHRAPPAG